MTEAEATASLVRESGLTFEYLDLLSDYDRRLLLGYKEPKPEKTREEVEQAMAAQFAMFAAYHGARKTR